MANKTSVRNSKRGDGNGVGSLMLAFVAFVFGYLIATIFDINQMHAWINHKMQAETSTKPQVHAKQERPKPKFEFYTVLAQDNRKDNKKPIVDRLVENPPKDLKSATKNLPVPGTLVNPVKDVGSQQANSLSKYVLQVGSFKNKIEAERMRAELVIKGFDVIIVTVNQQQENWYRVMVGPVISLKEAETLKLNLASRERINGMIRKIDV